MISLLAKEMSEAICKCFSKCALGMTSSESPGELIKNAGFWSCKLTTESIPLGVGLWILYI